jgi:GNAT superfamily N-acetyltransferase
LTTPLRIRSAKREDVPLIFSLVVALAEYERSRERVAGTEELLERALFGPGPTAEAVIAELDGQPAGFAVFFTTFSTWLCRPGIWLEDLFVLPARRRAGVGRALLGHVASVAQGRGCARLEWSALDWNTPALNFYDGLGAERLHEWEQFRLEGRALARIAAGPGAEPGF